MSIWAETFVETVRDMVLDGRWREALMECQSCLEGIDREQAEAILKGEKTLVGLSSTREGIEYVDDNFPTGRTYLSNLNYLFSGCISINRRLYQPRIVVTDFGPNDRLLRIGSLDPKDEFIFERYLDKKHLLNLSDLKERAKKYSYEKDVHVEFARFRNRPGTDGPRELPVIFEPAPDLPSWIAPHRTVQDAVDARLGNLRFSGHEAEFGKMTDWLQNNASQLAAKTFIASHKSVWHADEPEIEPDYSDRIAAILKQNEAGGFGTRQVDFGGSYGIREIPNGPLLRWALARLNRFEDAKIAIPDWKPINPSGMKMQNDDPSHTDWMMAAGLMDIDHYAISKPMDKLCADVQHEALGIKTHILVAGKDYAAGVIKFCRPDTPVDEETIAVIPHAGIDYIDIARSAAGVITINGGMMSHLAVNGLSEGFLIVRDERAKQKFKDGNFVAIDATTGTLELIAEEKVNIRSPNR
jgi:phosphohistidine swiveling domain-containing protein